MQWCNIPHSFLLYILSRFLNTASYMVQHATILSLRFVANRVSNYIILVYCCICTVHGSHLQSNHQLHPFCTEIWVRPMPYWICSSIPEEKLSW